MSNTKASAIDAEEELTLFESAGTPATSSTVRAVGRTSGITSGPSIADVTLATQRLWATAWRQRLREFDSDIWGAKSNLSGARTTTGKKSG